jgi:anaphase-promoting complex subunit 2
MVYLELLKMRFGERELQNLDVMVKDIIESRRIDATIHASSAKRQKVAIAPTFHANILSRLFWPSFKEQNLVLPAAIDG